MELNTTGLKFNWFAKAEYKDWLRGVEDDKVLLSYRYQKGDEDKYYEARFDLSSAWFMEEPVQ